VNYWSTEMSQTKLLSFSNANDAVPQKTTFATSNLRSRTSTSASIFQRLDIATSSWLSLLLLTVLLICFLGAGCTRKPVTVKPAGGHPLTTNSIPLSSTANQLKAIFTTTQIPSPVDGTIIDFQANNSVTNPGYNIVSYVWDFGDGSTYDHISAGHFYPHSSKIITVTLTVTDDHNNVATATAQMTP